MSAKYDGNTCPACGDEDVQSVSGPQLVEHGECFVPCECNTCGAKWHETYVLNGYDSLTTKS